MSSLEDLVLGALSEEESAPAKDFSDLPPVHVLRHRPTMALEDLLDICTLAEDEKKVSKLPYRAAQVVAYLTRLRLPHRVERSMMKSEEVFALVAEKKWKEVRKWIRSVRVVATNQIYLRDQSRILPDTIAQIDFLRDFFGEDLAQELREMSGVQMATVRRWIEGGNPAWAHRKQVQLLARTFYALRHASELDNDEALLWYKEGSPSPQDLVHGYSGNYGIGVDLRQKLAKIGYRD